MCVTSLRNAIYDDLYLYGLETHRLSGHDTLRACRQGETGNDQTGKLVIHATSYP